MRGRKPKPTVLHELHGTKNVTRHRNRASEPKAEGDIGIEPPDWLNAEQQAGWQYALKHAPKGVIKQIDRGILLIWVEAEHRHRTALTMQNKLDADNKLPLLFRTKDGPPGVSPYVAILVKAALVMMKAASELGFTPSSRPRLAADPPGDNQRGDWAKLKVIRGGKTG